MDRVRKESKLFLFFTKHQPWDEQYISIDFLLVVLLGIKQALRSSMFFLTNSQSKTFRENVTQRFPHHLLTFSSSAPPFSQIAKKAQWSKKKVADIEFFVAFFVNVSLSVDNKLSSARAFFFFKHDGVCDRLRFFASSKILFESPYCFINYTLRITQHFTPDILFFIFSYHTSLE